MPPDSSVRYVCSFPVASCRYAERGICRSVAACGAVEVHPHRAQAGPCQDARNTARPDQGCSMHTRIKLITVGLAAALLMALAAGSASAGNLSLSHGSLWRAVFRPLQFKSGSLVAAACEVTLEGSFHTTTIRKVERALIGYITKAAVGACERGAATVLTATLPWHVEYGGFTGSLPEISGVRLLLIGASFQIRDAILGSICLSRTSEAEPAAGIAELPAGSENRIVSGLRAEETQRIRCGSLNGAFAGTASVTEQPGGAANLLVKLI